MDARILEEIAGHTAQRAGEKIGCKSVGRQLSTYSSPDALQTKTGLLLRLPLGMFVFDFAEDIH